MLGWVGRTMLPVVGAMTLMACSGPLSPVDSVIPSPSPTTTALPDPTPSFFLSPVPVATPMPAPTPVPTATPQPTSTIIPVKSTPEVKADLAGITPLSMLDTDMTIQAEHDRAAAKRLEDFNRWNRACALHQAKVLPVSSVLGQFSNEDERAFRLGVVEVYGTTILSQLTYRANLTAFCRFKAQEPIINFFMAEDVLTAFLRYLTSPPPTSSSIVAQLNLILELRASDPLGPTAAQFQVFFSTPHQAVSAAMQAYIANVAPRQKYDAAAFITNIWASKIALNPEQYLTQDQILAIFGEFTRTFARSPTPTPIPTLTPIVESANHLHAGLEFAQEGRLDEAVDAFTEAIQLNPEDTQSYIERG